MRSSDRILRLGRTKVGAPSGDGATGSGTAGSGTAASGANASGANASGANGSDAPGGPRGGASTTSTVLRGTSYRSHAGSTAAAAPAAVEALLGRPGATRAAGGMSPEVAQEVRQLRQIAEERGYAAGHARALAELESAILAAGSIAERLEADAPRATAAVAHAIAELALAIARRVVAAEVQVNPAILVRSLEIAVGSVNGSPEARILLHPDAVEPVRAAWEAAHGSAFLGKRWRFEADPGLPPGGCVLRYEHGFVDAGLEAQLEEMGIALDAAIPGFWRDAAEEAGAA